MLWNKDGYLKVSASAKKKTAGRIVRRERYSGNCSRSFYVGEGFTEEDIKTKFDNGELMISVQKKHQKRVEKEINYNLLITRD